MISRRKALAVGMLFAGKMWAGDFLGPPVGGGFHPVFQKGVIFSHNHSKSAGYGTGTAADSLLAIRELGADAVAIIPIGYSFNIHHPEIFGYRGEDLTMSRDHITRVIHDAQTRGLRVVLNPHLWIGVHWGEGEWRGYVRMLTEEDWDRWFEQYGIFITYFAEIAAECRVDLFCVGSELEGTTLSHPERWRSLIRKVRGIYSGPCTYSANWGGEFEAISFWDELEYIGISAYFPIGDGGKDARLAEAAKVRDRLAALHQQTKKPILFLEAGFQSRPGAGKEPSAWRWNVKEPSDVEEQRLCYEVYFQTFWPQPWFFGVYWWQWFADPVYDAAQTSGYPFRGKPAEEVVRQWFSKPAPR